MKKVIIQEDSSCEMLSITIDGDSLFYGNYWDFNRDGNSFKYMFEKLGIDVELIEKEYYKWKQ